MKRRLLTLFAILFGVIAAQAQTTPTTITIQNSSNVTIHGGVLQVAGTFQLEALCTYSAHASDNCTFGGGVTWISSRATSGDITVSSGGLVTAVNDPGAGANTSADIVAQVNGFIDQVNGRVQFEGQHVGDTWYLYPTPDFHAYSNQITGAALPLNVAVGSTVAVGVGFQINSSTPGGTGIPFQEACTWGTSDATKATVNVYGIVTAVGTGSVTITCGLTGNGVYGSSTASGWVSPGNTVSLTITAASPSPVTWYVRPDGGTPYVNGTQTPSGQCDGKHDASYASTGGTGVNQPCAMGNFRYLWADGVTYQLMQWMIAGGDTVIIRQKSGGYLLGLDGPYTGGYAPTNCQGNPFGCYMPTIPSGTSANHTKILGENYASCTSNSLKTQLDVSWASSEGVNVQDSQFIDVACVNVTDLAQCASNSNFTDVCGTGDNAGGDGILSSALAGNNTFTDVWVHGLSHDGFHGATGVGDVFTRFVVASAPDGGVQMDDDPWGIGNISVAGGMDWEGGSVSFTGCVEQYPIVLNYPYIECRDQSTGGYGDGVGTASTIGTWKFNQVLFAYNFQDGLDLLHSGMQELDVTNSMSIGNVGQSYKIGSGPTVNFINNWSMANCNRLAYPVGDMPSGAITPGIGYCRAADQIKIIFDYFGTIKFQYSSFSGTNSVVFDEFSSGDDGNHMSTIFQNNAVLGYADNNMTSNTGVLPAFYFPSTLVPANLGWSTRSYNYFYNLKAGSSNPCSSTLLTGEVCAAPGWLNQYQTSTPIPTPDSNETVLDTITGAVVSGSPLIGAGTCISGITTDINGTPRCPPTPPTIGAYNLIVSATNMFNMTGTVNMTGKVQ